MESDKTLFEIYRERSYDKKYRVVYFTELNEHNKEQEINRALAGDSFYEGFLRNYRKEEAKAIINQFLQRLNNGEQVDPAELDTALAEYMP
ncbi:MAG TPA: hypothetical protein VNM22_10190 [Candidatus Limnocylindrales bacterium]|jgi:hypothetical protein|nr:hypothetical protein [Candidatus Limnocylindrales bacterium]